MINKLIGFKRDFITIGLFSIIFCLLTACGAPSSSIQAEESNQNNTYPVGSNPMAATFGDFNNDGNPDVAVANYSDGTISVLLGRGDGTLGTQTTYSVLGGPTSVEAGDFNEDGFLDLIVSTSLVSTEFNPPAGSLNAVYLLLGQAQGFGSTTLIYQLSDGSNPNQVLVADFNHDGKLDFALAVENTENGSVLVFMNQGNGLFSKTPTTTLSLTLPVNSIAVSDFNGDSHPDLAILQNPLLNNTTGTVSVTLGNGNGGFGNLTQLPVGENPSFVSTADLNADNNMDILVSNNDSDTVSVFLGTSNGQFTPVITPYPVGKNPSSVLAVGVNESGYPNLAVTNLFDNTLLILPGLWGGQSFQVPVTNEGTHVIPPNLELSTGTQPIAMALGDLNKDGQPDIVVVNQSDNNISVILGKNATAVLGQQTTYCISDTSCAGLSNDPATDYAPIAAATADLNGDSVPDFVIVNEDDNSISVFLGKGDGTFQVPVIYSVGQGPGFVSVADLSGDAFPELVVANFTDKTISILPNDRRGGFNNSVQPLNLPPAPYSAVVGEVTNDGYLDLVVGASKGVYVFSGGGATTYFNTTPIVLTSALPVTSISLGDFNADDQLDVLTINQQNQVILFLGPITANSQAASSQTYCASPTPVTFSMAVADFNQDGNLDIATPTCVVLGDGTGHFNTLLNHSGNVETLNSGVNPISMAVADFDQDKRLDLIMADAAANTVSVFLGNGDGRFSNPSTYATGKQPTCVAVADFNQDNRPDVVVGNREDNTASVFLGSFSLKNAFNLYSPGGNSCVYSKSCPQTQPLFCAAFTSTKTCPSQQQQICDAQQRVCTDFKRYAFSTINQYLPGTIYDAKNSSKSFNSISDANRICTDVAAQQHFPPGNYIAVLAQKNTSIYDTISAEIKYTTPVFDAKTKRYLTNYLTGAKQDSICTSPERNLDCLNSAGPVFLGSEFFDYTYAIWTGAPGRFGPGQGNNFFETPSTIDFTCSNWTVRDSSGSACIALGGLDWSSWGCICEFVNALMCLSADPPISCGSDADCASMGVGYACSAPPPQGRSPEGTCYVGRHVFITENQYLYPSTPGVSDITGDSFCQAEADQPGSGVPPGTYKAMLSAQYDQALYSTIQPYVTGQFPVYDALKRRVLLEHPALPSTIPATPGVDGTLSSCNRNPVGLDCLNMQSVSRIGNGNQFYWSGVPMLVINSIQYKDAFFYPCSAYKNLGPGQSCASVCYQEEAFATVGNVGDSYWSGWTTNDNSYCVSAMNPLLCIQTGLPGDS